MWHCFCAHRQYRPKSHWPDYCWFCSSTQCKGTTFCFTHRDSCIFHSIEFLHKNHCSRNAVKKLVRQRIMGTLHNSKPKFCSFCIIITHMYSSSDSTLCTWVIYCYHVQIRMSIEVLVKDFWPFHQKHWGFSQNDLCYMPWRDHPQK